MGHKNKFFSDIELEVEIIKGATKSCAHWVFERCVKCEAIIERKMEKWISKNDTKK